MKENLKFRLDVVQSRLAQLNEQTAAPRLWRTQFAVEKQTGAADAAALEREAAKLRRQLADRRVHHAAVQVQRALKAARATEQLKIKKRRKKAPDSAALEAEAAVVAGLEPAAWARDIVDRQLTKFYADSGLAPADKRALSQPESNVLGRLCKVQSVKSALDGLLGALAAWYEPGRELPAGALAAQGAGKATSGSGETDDHADADAEFEAEGADAADGFDDAERPGRFGGFDDARVPEIANTDDESSMEEDDGAGAGAGEPEVDDFFAEDLAVNDPVGDDTPLGLPALTHGYISGSDGESEPEGPAPERRNRRGQRARRKIWEMKYGQRAKHVVKEQQEHRRQQDEKEARRQRREAKQREDAGRRAAVRARQNDPATLHPSWQAKKRAAEAEKVAFAGKKTKFE